MRTYPILQGNTRTPFYAKLLSLFMLFFTASFAFAQTIVINGNKVITKRTVYNDVVLDMTNGSFTVEPGGSLIIKDSQVNVTISAQNPFFAKMNAGSLSLQNNDFNVIANNIVVNPLSKPTYQLIQVKQADIAIEDNKFVVDKSFSVGFFDTENKATYRFNVNHNDFRNFHGGIYLVNTSFASITNNSFTNVSLANIFISGKNSALKGNLFTFSGNLQVGDAIDVVGADSIKIEDNIIGSSSGYGIYILGSANLIVNDNKITDGKSYAVFIDQSSALTLQKNPIIPAILANAKLASTSSSNISLTNNYLALNRYGITGSNIDGFDVDNNIFIQRFSSAKARQFWTNNDVLLKNVTSFNWDRNVYKEAFTQEVPGNNKDSLQFVPYPKHGGVVLP